MPELLQRKHKVLPADMRKNEPPDQCWPGGSNQLVRDNYYVGLMPIMLRTRRPLL